MPSKQKTNSSQALSADDKLGHVVINVSGEKMNPIVIFPQFAGHMVSVL